LAASRSADLDDCHVGRLSQGFDSGRKRSDGYRYHHHKACHVGQGESKTVLAHGCSSSWFAVRNKLDNQYGTPRIPILAKRDCRSQRIIAHAAVPVIALGSFLVFEFARIGARWSHARIEQERTVNVDQDPWPLS
jgi:hypothetical protein